LKLENIVVSVFRLWLLLQPLFRLLYLTSENITHFILLFGYCQKLKKKKEKKKEDVLLTKPQLQLTNYFVVWIPSWTIHYLGHIFQFIFTGVLILSWRLLLLVMKSNIPVWLFSAYRKPTISVSFHMALLSSIWDS
jgi:hypothetical protein